MNHSNKMPEFQIDWPISGVLPYSWSKTKETKLELNDEWSIVCEVQKDVRDVWKYCAIKIHRKTVTQEVEITGSLSFDYKKDILWTEQFSRFIKSGSRYSVLVPNPSTKFYADHSRLVGHVKISGTSCNRESKEEIQLKSLEQLSKDFERSFDPDSTCFADVVLKCGGASIPGHRFILSSRSCVFATMFANPMKERLTNVVSINDLNESVLRAVLRYTYTGKTPDLTAELAADLLFAAEKYQLQDLKTVCTHFLKNTMSLQDVWNLLVQGDMLSEDLKSFALHYICDNYVEFSDLEETQEWRDLKKERPRLALELAETLLKYRDGTLKILKVEE